MAPVVLHRCRTPTDWLCPCGRVARTLRREGIEATEVRVPFKRREREDVRALTRQDRVPVLVLEDGDAICDSLRIVDALERRRFQG